MKKYKTKALLVPIAAFAVTVTGVSAFNSEMLDRENMVDEHPSTLEHVHQLRKEGDTEGVHDMLMRSGVDMNAAKQMHQAMNGQKQSIHEKVADAMKDGDYQAFLQAVENSPMMEKIDTPEEFDLFTKAYDLKESGDMTGARAIMEDIGFEGMMQGKRTMYEEDKWNR